MRDERDACGTYGGGILPMLYFWGSLKARSVEKSGKEYKGIAVPGSVSGKGRSFPLAVSAWRECHHIHACELSNLHMNCYKPLFNVGNPLVPGKHKLSAPALIVDEYRCKANGHSAMLCKQEMRTSRARLRQP